MRIEDLLQKQTKGPLEVGEQQELLAFEALDELLSLVNPLVRNSTNGPDSALVRTA